MKFIFLSALLLIFTNQCFAQLLISEVLFNPKNGGVDFVEIYNNSSIAIPLDRYYLGHVNSSGEMSNLQQISTGNVVIRPETYKVLTIDPTTVIQHYPTAKASNILKMHRLPSYPNTQGHVLLVHQEIDRNGNQKVHVVDSLHYTEKMHSLFIKDRKGISLERYSFSEPTNAPGNFRSAAVSVGGATPGFQNSVEPHATTWFRMNAKIINPTIGPVMQLEIEYELDRSSMMANVHIYNQKGMLVRRILQNKSISTKGKWIWEGKQENQTFAPLGVYTAYIELYDGVGYRQVIRKSFVLTH